MGEAITKLDPPAHLQCPLPANQSSSMPLSPFSCFASHDRAALCAICSTFAATIATPAVPTTVASTAITTRAACSTAFTDCATATSCPWAGTHRARHLAGWAANWMERH